MDRRTRFSAWRNRRTGISGSVQQVDCRNSTAWIFRPICWARHWGCPIRACECCLPVKPADCGLHSMARSFCCEPISLPIVVKENVPPQRVETMQEDRTGALWLGYRAGPLCRIAAGKAETFNTSQGLPRSNSPIPSLAIDNQGQLWLARGTHIGLMRDGHYSDVKQMPDACFIASASSGGLWVCSGAELYKFDGSTLQPLATLPIPRDPSSLQRLLEDHSGALWIGSSTSGLFRYDAAGLENIPTLRRAQITCLIEDHEGSLWVGSDSGLDRVSPRAIETQGPENGLPLGAARSICQAPDGSIWGVMANGYAVMVRGGQTDGTPPLLQSMTPPTASPPTRAMPSGSARPATICIAGNPASWITGIDPRGWTIM